MTSRSTHHSMVVSALCFAVIGLALLFAAEEVTAMLKPGMDRPLPAGVLGAAYLGFATMNWTARSSVLGGIYGRAVVAGNLTHLTVGAILLVKSAVENTGMPLLYWVLAGFYVLGAVYFSYLAFFSAGIAKEEQQSSSVTGAR